MLACPILLLAAFVARGISQTIDPNSVPLDTRATWCTTQKSSCPLLCAQVGATADSNDCYPKTLEYSCICSNNQQPNVSEYSQTIPYFECTETANQCVGRCASGDDGCASQCRTSHPCGAQSPKRVNLTSTSSAVASATSTQANDYNGFGGPASTSSSSAHGLRYATIFEQGGVPGLFLTAGGLCAGLGLFL